MRARSQSRFLVGTVKEILGTCMVKLFFLVVAIHVTCSLRYLFELLPYSLSDVRLMADTRERSLKLSQMASLRFPKNKSIVFIVGKCPGRRLHYQF